MEKQKIMAEILLENPTASAHFLSQFPEEELLKYLNRLKQAYIRNSILYRKAGKND